MKKFLFVLPFILGMSIPSFAAGEFNSKKSIENNFSNATLLAHNSAETSCKPPKVKVCTTVVGIESCVCIGG